VEISDWNLDDDEFGTEWSPRARTAYPDMGGATPILVLVEKIPLIARILLLHMQIAIAIPFVILAATAMYYSRFLPELLVVSCPLGFVIGARNYFQALNAFLKGERSPEQVIANIVLVKPNPWYIVIWGLGLPLGLFVGSVTVLWSHNRFIAVAIPATVTFALFAKWGSEPIRFYEQFLLSQVEFDNNAKLDKALPKHGPDPWILATILMGIVSLPILVSSTFALFALVIGLSAYCAHVFLPFWQRTDWVEAIVYFLTFAYRVCQRFVAYPEVLETRRPIEDAQNWAPPSTATHRSLVFFGLLGSLYLTLIVGLSYYCPWEIFAKLTLEIPDSFASEGVLHGYWWLFAPFFLTPLADPLAVYLFTFVFGIAGFALIPPTILLVIYFPQLVALERIRQEKKAEANDTVS